MNTKVLKNARKDKGITGKEMSELLGISHEYYRRIEIGTQEPSVRLIAKMSENLGVSTDKLIFTTQKLNKLKNGQKEPENEVKIDG